MARLDRTTLGETLARELRAEIEAGRWSTTLPGYRELGRLYRVSQPTCKAALAILEKAGLIVSGGPRRRWQIVATGLHRSGATSHVVVWFGEVEEKLMEESTRSVLAELRRLCSRGRVHLRIGNSLRSKRAEAVAGNLIKRYQPDRVVLHNAPERMIVAMTERGVSVLALGGEMPRDRPVEGMGQSLEQTYRQIVENLVQSGRRRILIPVRSGRPGWLKAAATGLIEGGAPDPRRAAEWTPLIDDDFPEALRTHWQSLLEKSRPDAVVVIDAPWVLSLYSAGWKAGLRPGHDFVVVTTDSPSLLGWLDPPPVMLRMPSRQMERHMARWLRNPDPSRGLTLITPAWPEGAL